MGIPRVARTLNTEPRAAPKSWAPRPRSLGAANNRSSTAREPVQQSQLAIEQCARGLAIDRPTPRIGHVERAADLAGAAVRHVEEAPRIAATAATAFGEVVHDATRGALHLISGLGTVFPELRDHGPQGTNQVYSNGVRNKHVLLQLSVTGKGTPPADDLRGWAPPVATDPRQDP